MDALTTLYTTLETLQEQGKLTDGVYLEAMNALQSVYNSVPRPPPAATAAAAPLTGGASTAQPNWKTNWQSLFSDPWPAHFNHDCPAWIQAALTAITQWAALTTRPVFKEMITPELMDAHGCGSYHSGHEYTRKMLLDWVAHTWLNYGKWRNPALEEELRTDKSIRPLRVERAARKIIMWQGHLSHFSTIAEFCSSETKLAKWLHENIGSLYCSVKRRKGGRYWATEPVDTANLHKVAVVFPNITPDITPGANWTCEFWTPRVQLGRARIEIMLGVLRTIVCHLLGGDFHREMLYSDLGDRSYSEPENRLSHWAPHRECGLHLTVSGITGTTRQMRRTYEAKRPDTTGSPWLAVIYQDALNTGGEEAVANSSE